MIKGYRQRYYNDESVHCPSVPLPETYCADKEHWKCMDKCLQDLNVAQTEVKQLDILNEFLDNFTKSDHTPEERKIVYRFVYEWRLDMNDRVAQYYFKELLQLLFKKDPEVLKEAVNETITDVLCEYPGKYTCLNTRNDLARKFVGFLDDFLYTAETLEIKWKSIFSILSKFMQILRELPAESDEMLIEKLLFNTTSGIKSIIFKFHDKITINSCQNEMDSLLPNLLFHMPNERLNREIRNNCGHSVVLILKKNGKLMNHIENIDDGSINCSNDVTLLYFEGIFCNELRIIDERENMWKILRICSKIIFNKLYDDFWGESIKTYHVLAVVVEMSRIIKDNLSNIIDWAEDEVHDLLICLEIFYTLCQKTAAEHYLKQILTNIMYFCKNQVKSTFVDFEKKVFSSTLTVDCSPKLRGQIIFTLCEIYSSTEILERMPDVLGVIHEDIRRNRICDTSCHGEACLHQNPSIKVFVELCKATTDPRSQYEIFLKDLLQECHKHPHGGWYRKQIKALVKELLSWSNHTMLYIIQETDKIPIEMVFYAQACMKKYPENFPRNTTQCELLKKGLITFEEDSRVTAAKVLQGVCWDLENLNLILNFLRFGIVLQHKPYENKINWIAVLNGVVVYGKKDSHTKVVVSEFLTKFQEILFTHFYRGGSLPRQRYALKILKDTWSFFDENTWEIRHLDAVFSCFDSPYEYVKKLMTQCLKMFPKQLLMEWIEVRFGASEKIQHKLKKMMTSVKPADSLKAAYQLVLMSSFASKIFSDEHIDDEHKSDNILITLEWCLQALSEGTINAKKSILKASASNPLYGTILCIRYLLDDLPKANIKGVPQFIIKETPRWKRFYENLVLLCNEVSQLVAPIVNSSSPEGFIPEDSELIGDSCDEHITSQMVLLCGWRTIKEVTLLLGEICEKTPLSTNLITRGDIFKIGENFFEILLATKHRGAFEVSAVGFSKLCMRLRLSTCMEINNLPKEWLNNLLDAVLCPKENDDSAKYVKLCITRRSAGLPFIIQSILTSYDPLLLDTTINRLHRESKKNTDGRVHSMNILRYIFRCSTLKTFNYAKDGLKIAIESFGSPSWTERNSASLLFSAIIVRMFGVCRAKGASEELPFVNTWIFNEFFEDAPGLYKFMLCELKNGGDQLEHVGSAPQLYPIFLLLERLPTLNGHYGPKWHSGEYVEEIERISVKCHDLRIRVLAVKALITIIHPTEYENRLKWLFRKEISKNPNDFHCRMLQVKEIFRKFAKKDISYVLNNLNNLIGLHMLQSNNCLLIEKLFMELLVKYFPKINHDEQKCILSDYARNYLINFLANLQIILESNGTVLGRTAVQCPYLLLKLTLAVNVESAASILIDTLKNANSVFFNATYISALNIVLLLNGCAKHEIPEEILCDIPDIEMEFVSFLTEQQKQDIKSLIISSDENLFEHLTRNDNPFIRSRAFLCMPLTRHNQIPSLEVINSTLAQNNEVPNEEKILIVRKILAQPFAIENILALNVGDLLEFCGNEMNEFTRVNIALLVAEILKILSKNVEYVHNFYVCLTQVIMQLLRDDDSDVRRIVCKAILAFTSTIRQIPCNAFIHSSDELNIPCDSYALFLFIETLVNFIIPKNKCSLFLLGLIKVEEVDASRETEKICDDEWKVFDTKEANLFADREYSLHILRSFLYSFK